MVTVDITFNLGTQRGLLGPVLQEAFPSIDLRSDIVIIQDAGEQRVTSWNDTKLGAAPTQVTIDQALVTYVSKSNKRDGLTQLQAIAMEFLIAFIVNQRFADNTRLVAVNAKIDAWKSAHPGAIP